jgi:hypothetical protein
MAACDGLLQGLLWLGPAPQPGRPGGAPKPGRGRAMCTNRRPNRSVCSASRCRYAPEQARKAGTRSRIARSTGTAAFDRGRCRTPSAFVSPDSNAQARGRRCREAARVFRRNDGGLAHGAHDVQAIQEQAKHGPRAAGQAQPRAAGGRRWQRHAAALRQAPAFAQGAAQGAAAGEEAAPQRLQPAAAPQGRPAGEARPARGVRPVRSLACRGAMQGRSRSACFGDARCAVTPAVLPWPPWPSSLQHAATPQATKTLPLLDRPRRPA